MGFGDRATGGGGGGGSGLSSGQVQALIDAAEVDLRRKAEVVSTAANRQLAEADRGKTIRLTGSTARTFTTAAGLPAGWWARLLNTATEDLTFDVGIADRIIGAGQTRVIPPGECVAVQALGAATWAGITDTEQGDGGEGGTDATAREAAATAQAAADAAGTTAAANTREAARLQLEIEANRDSAADARRIAVANQGEFPNYRRAADQDVIDRRTAAAIPERVPDAPAAAAEARTYELGVGTDGATGWVRGAAAATDQTARDASAAAQTTANSALARTQRLRPVSQWVRGLGAQTLLLEWKPNGPVANAAALGVNVSGVNVAGITSPSAIAAGDRQGVVVSVAVNAANAGSIDRAPNTGAGHVEIQVTHGGVTDTCWMGVSTPRVERLANEAAYNAITTKNPGTIYWWP